MKPQTGVGAAKQPFKALLEEATGSGPVRLSRGASMTVPPGLASKSLSPSIVRARLPPRAEAAHAAELSRTGRARVNAEADRLTSVRAHHDLGAAKSEATRSELAAVVEERVTTHVVDQIVRELLAELEIGSLPQPGEHPSHALTMNMTPAPVPGVTSSTLASPVREARAEQAVELIEKIEVFVRSQRPALALTLNNSLGARVEIERLGPGQVALKLVGCDGPPSAEAVSRIREEMKLRGLRVAALSIA